MGFKSEKIGKKVSRNAKKFKTLGTLEIVFSCKQTQVKGCGYIIIAPLFRTLNKFFLICKQKKNPKLPDDEKNFLGAHEQLFFVLKPKI